MKKIAKTSALIIAVTAISLGVARTSGAVNQSISMATSATSAQLLAGCSSGASSEMWRVSLSIKVSSGSEQTVTFQDTEFWAKYNSTSLGSNQIQNDVTVLDSGGFVAGTQIAPHETKTFTPTLQVSLPCDTQGADMFSGLHLVGNTKQYSDGATFVGGNTPVPAGAAGVVTATVLVGGLGVLVQRRRRRTLVAAGPVR